jgi:hypothetical protein
LQIGRIREFTFPNCEDIPLSVSERIFGLLIALTVAREFLGPISHIAGGSSSDRAIWVLMLMPKAAVHQDRLAAPRESNVWLSRSLTEVNPEAVS